MDDQSSEGTISIAVANRVPIRKLGVAAGDDRNMEHHLQLCSTRLDARALEGSRELLQQSNSQLEKQMDSASKQIDRLTEQNTALRWDLDGVKTYLEQFQD
ncbi:hypothetical protein EJ05DRAFT_505987 [Pseudovirgaria hyperparasitica]|uniref:Uncharacterized protein n=1 Tax=Pseudovirgaria hyperparasitica TaxID=470096 RepID=A0A6A6VQM6_9PEZI|nr:uncharacterized protein EJ05DRAFT_505987 [Pseudovirgaria hyperparasitica]KAF2752503.1 hypothetical protein EJ05DRAFT_505987 [Pseudovirgaria hyperparasitica]